MDRESSITIRVREDEVAALDEIVSSIPLRNRSQYIKAAINAYAQKVIFQ